MRLLADENSGMDLAVLAAVSEKAGTESLGSADIDDCFTAFAWACNNVDSLRFEIGTFTQSYQFDFDGMRYAVVLTDGRCATYSGEFEQPDITMRMSALTLLGLLNGSVDAGVAHMNGDISCRGTKNGSVKLQAIFDLFLDELGV